LFLVHFSRDKKVFGVLTEVVASLFANSKPLRLGDETRDFVHTIRDAKKLSLPQSVAHERDRMNKARDEHNESHGDGLRERKEPVGSLLNDLIVLFKTSEILGQVLKEQYATITRVQREPIVTSLLDAYMRAAGGIIRDMALNREKLSKWLVHKTGGADAKLSDAERAELAQSLVSELVQMFMFAFFQKLADCVSSDRTLDLIKNIQWADSLESKVFLLSCELNLQRSYPMAKIDDLLAAAEGDVAFVSLLRNLVQVRVSLFHSRAAELQALAQRFNFDVGRLNVLEFKGHRIR
jgi:hypothetical protein